MLPSPTLQDLRGSRRILCVQPHYDDNDIGAGGTFAALQDAGIEMVYLTVTDDLAGVLDPELANEQAAQQLKAEQMAAGAIIGITTQLWLNFPDAGDFSYFDLRRHLVGAIRRLRPDFVFTCDPWLPYEAHQDHIRTGLAAAEAAILYNLPRFHSLPEVDAAYRPYALSGVGFYLTHAPNVIFDITATQLRKHAALDCYRAQFTPQDLDALHSLLKQRESQAGQAGNCTYGEPLKLLLPSQLHLNTQVWRA